MIFCCECSNITFENIELFNAPYWTCFLHGCEQVALHNLNIYTDRRTHNGDGIDLDCCRFVSISDCRIDTGDDCLALRACAAPLKQPRYSEFITISNCILRSRCDAIRLGVGDGVIRNVIFSNIIIHDTSTCINITSQYSAKSVGVQIENIDFNNIQLTSCARPLLICSHTLGPQNTPAKKKIAHLHFSGIHGEASFSSFIEGNCRKDIQDIRFTNLHLRYFGGNEIQSSPNGDRTGSAVPAAFWINHATGICFENTSLKWIPEASSLWKWSIHASDADIEVSNCSLDKKMMEQ
ncbi:MAG: hypothetical protein IKO93_13300, partial [Lentisphaeria bacterium]|nr:hypothetical protein [Lentisphaeria bacterium]